MFRSILICLFTLFLFACSNNPNATTPEITQAITLSTLNYVKRHSTNPAAKVNIIAIVQSGDYARVRVIPVKPLTDPAYAFLKLTSQGWEVISLGTAFDQSFYKKYQIPKALQL